MEVDELQEEDVNPLIGGIDDVNNNTIPWSIWVHTWVDNDNEDIENDDDDFGLLLCGRNNNS